MQGTTSISETKYLKEPFVNGMHVNSHEKQKIKIESNKAGKLARRSKNMRVPRMSIR